MYKVEKFKKQLLRCQPTAFTSKDIAELSDKYFSNNRNKFEDNIKTVFYKVISLEKEIFENCYALTTIDDGSISVICKSDINLQKGYLEPFEEQNKPESSMKKLYIGISPEENERERQLANIVLFLIFTVIIGGSLISMFKCSKWKVKDHVYDNSDNYKRTTRCPNKNFDIRDEHKQVSLVYFKSINENYLE